MRADKVCDNFGTCITHADLLNNLLSQIKVSEFLKKSSTATGANRPPNEQLLVVTVDEILRISKLNNWAMCMSQGMIYIYNGSFWSSVDDESMKRFLSSAAEKLGINRYKAKYFQWASQLLQQFHHSADLPTPDQSGKKVYINFLNGTFEISDSRQFLREFRPEDFLRYQLPFGYDPDATAPKFQKFLDEVLPDKATQDLLAEYFGYIFIPASQLKLEKILLLYGSGANGKSVIFEIISAMLGKEANVSNFSLRSLTNDNGYYRAMLGGKLLNYSSDVSGKMDDGFFKLLASGEPIEARLPYGKPFIVSNYGKLIFNLNELPMGTDLSNAYFRRLIIVPFEKTIPEALQNKGLAQEIIESELSGVFNWALAGLHRLLKNRKLTDSEVVTSAVQDYLRSADSVSQFLDDEDYLPGNEDGILLDDLYVKYSTYCKTYGHYPCSKKKMRQRLTNLKFHISRRGPGMYVETKNVFFRATQLHLLHKLSR
jgi:putative DNA primase/helicase